MVKENNQAVVNKDERIINFCKCVFECYDKHRVNSHIARPNRKHLGDTNE